MNKSLLNIWCNNDNFSGEAPNDYNINIQNDMIPEIYS